MTGGGVAFADDGSQSRVLEPFDGADDNDKPDDGWRVAAYPDSTSDVTAIAVCARGNYGYRMQTVGPFMGTTVTAPQAECLDGEAVTGGGADVGGTSPEARIVHSSPQDGLDSGDVPDDRWDSGVRIPSVATATGIAICK